MRLQATNLQLQSEGGFYYPESGPDFSVDPTAELAVQRNLRDHQRSKRSLQLDDALQVLPDLGDEEYEALKKDIEKHGVQEPIVVDEQDVVIDGHHRVKAWRELGYDTREIPRKVRRDLNEKEKRQLAYRLNLQRRHLNSGQKREIAKQYLKTEWDGQATEEEVADILGVGKTTVHRAKESLRADGKLVHVDCFSTEEQRRQIRDYLEEHPEAADREVARNIPADISHPTVGKRRDEIESSSSAGPSESPSNPTDSSSTHTVSTPVDNSHPESDEKATPRYFVEPIAEAVSGFDLDPASGAEDEPLAEENYTIEEDGLKQEWYGDVWVNPPFSDMNSWVDKIQSELSANRVDTVVLLCRGDNSTGWWQKAAELATLVVAVDHRLTFDGDSTPAPFPVHLMIFGPITRDLIEVLEDKGHLLNMIEDPDRLTYAT